MSANSFNALGLKAAPVDPLEEMALFDTLPPAVRARISTAPVAVAVRPLARFWREARGTEAQRHDRLIQVLDDKFQGVAA